MATQRQLIYTTRTILRNGSIIDDDKLTDRQIAFIHDSIRALLLRRQYDKGQSLSDNHIQHLQCLPLEAVETSFIPGLSLDCKVYRTGELPSFIESKQKDLITNVSPPEFNSTGYDLVHYARLPYATNTRFKLPLATLYNGRIYIINAPYTTKINVSGVFETPNDLSGYSDCSGTTCYDWDSDYPLSAHLIDDLIKLSLVELQGTLQVPIDKVNDSAQSLQAPNQ
jgi:hypothetical protein